MSWWHSQRVFDPREFDYPGTAYFIQARRVLTPRAPRIIRGVVIHITGGPATHESGAINEFLARHVRTNPAGRVVPAGASAHYIVNREGIVIQTVHEADIANHVYRMDTRRKQQGAQSAIEALLERQQRAPLPALHGATPGLSTSAKEPLKAGVSEVMDQGTEVVVLFSLLNEQDHAVQIMPPQIQLGGKRSQGFPIRRSKWVTAEQLPILDFRLSRRRLGPGERADGVVVFERPSFKQSNEALMLQVAESGAVDRPALAPIGFGISRSIKEVNRAAK